MTNQKLIGLCRQALDQTNKHGADAAEAYGESARTITVTIEKNDLQISRSHKETMIGIRAFKGKRIGFASTNDPQTLDETCADAVVLANASPADERNLLPEVEDIEYVDGIYDPHSETFTTKDAIEQAVKILDIARSIDSRLIVGNGEFSVHIGTRALANSNGILRSEQESLFFYFALATARDGERVSNMDYQFDATRNLSTIDVEPIVRRACENALGSLGAEPGDSFNGPIILSPNAVQGILAGLILFQTDAKNILRGMSRWKESVDTAVASPLITVVDDGRAKDGIATSSFDREGVGHARLELIKDGRLMSFMHNTYTAAAMKTKNTAHAAGPARSLPRIGPTNFEIVPGSTTKDALISEMKKGVLVTRFSGRADPISGDFSGVAKGAYLIENGRVTRPVKGTLVAGNAFEALKKLSGVSREQERVFNFTLPYLRLEGISVTAG
jgi:PmbA protein